jgi:hypothetical protein
VKTAVQGSSRSLSVLALAILAGCGGPYLDRVQGQVIDESGRPIAGARVKLSGPDHLVTDSEGRFDGMLTFHSRRSVAVSALKEEERLGGIVSVSRRHEPITIVMRPHVRVSGRVSYEKLPHSIAALHQEPRDQWPAIHIRKKFPELNQWFHCGAPTLSQGAIECYLNAGDYEVEVTGLHERLARNFQVAAKGGDIDLGVLEAEPLTEHKLIDLPAPELHLGNGSRLADLRGKWVLLLMWDRQTENDLAIRRLVRFHNDPQVDPHGFAIVAVHRTALDSADLVRLRTHDRDGLRPEPIPFPILFDEEGKAFEAYGLRIDATALWVINPEGRVEFLHWMDPVDFVRSRLKPRGTP